MLYSFSWCIVLPLMLLDIGVGHAPEECVKMCSPEARNTLSFGVALASSGDALAVGALGTWPRDDEKYGSGKVFLYLLTEGEDEQLVDVLESREESCKRMFGNSLFFEDGILGVGAPSLKEECSGIVSLYRFDGRKARHEQTLVAPKEVDSRTFGASVAIEGEWLFVGSPGHRDDDAVGSVVVYRNEGHRFEIKQILRDHGHARGSRYGISIATVSGQLIIGSSCIELGRADMYRLQHGQWIPTQTIMPNGEAEECGKFGMRIVAHGQFVAISNYSGDAAGGESRERGRCTAAVWMYEIVHGHAIERGMLTPPQTERESYYGMSLSLLDNVLYVGDPTADWYNKGEGKVSDAVHVYKWRESSWELSNSIVRVHDGAIDEPAFGVSCHAMQNGFLAIGAIGAYPRRPRVPDPGCVFLHRR